MKVSVVPYRTKQGFSIFFSQNTVSLDFFKPQQIAILVLTLSVDLLATLNAYKGQKIVTV